MPTVSPRRAAHSYTYQARASLKQKNPSGCSASNKSLTAGQCRPVVQHIDDQMIVIVEAGVPERRLIAFQTIVLRNQRLQATHIGDTCASGLNQSGGGVVADLELVRFHARDFAKRVGGIHQHQWRLGQRGRHMGDAVRHLGVQKAVGAVSLECGDLVLLAVLAVGAHGDEHIAELACSGLRAQNHTAGVRGGGHLLTDETEDCVLLVRSELASGLTGSRAWWRWRAHCPQFWTLRAPRRVR